MNITDAVRGVGSLWRKPPPQGLSPASVLTLPAKTGASAVKKLPILPKPITQTVVQGQPLTIKDIADVLRYNHNLFSQTLEGSIHPLHLTVFARQQHWTITRTPIEGETGKFTWKLTLASIKKFDITDEAVIDALSKLFNEHYNSKHKA